MKLKDHISRKLSDADCYRSFAIKNKEGAHIATAQFGNDGKCNLVIYGNASIGYDCIRRVQNNFIVEVGKDYSLQEQNQETLVQEIESILNLIPKIAQAKNSADMLATQVEGARQEITDLSKRSSDFNLQVQNLTAAANNFRIEDTVKSFSGNQRAHILLKIWGRGDQESAQILQAIKSQGFNPNYFRNSDGASLVKKALDEKDVPLFDSLLAQKIDFSATLPGGESPASLLFKSKNPAFLQKAFATKQDFSKALFCLLALDDGLSLEFALKADPKLAEATYKGDTILRSAIKSGKNKIVEKILDLDPESLKRPGPDSISPFALACLLEKEGAVNILKGRIDPAAEIKNAASCGYAKLLIKILAKNPETLHLKYENMPLGHFVIKYAKEEKAENIVKELLNAYPALAKEKDESGNDLAEFALINGKIGAFEASLKGTDLGRIFLKEILSDGKHKELLAEFSLKDGAVLEFLAKETLKDPIAAEKISKMELPSWATDSSGGSLLHSSCRFQNLELAKKLLEKNPKLVDKQDSRGKTPLHLVLEGGGEAKDKAFLVEAFLPYGPNLEIKDDQNHSVKELGAEYISVLEVFSKFEAL